MNAASHPKFDIAHSTITHMTPTDLQETNERRFARKHINGYIDTAIRENPENEAKVHAGVRLLEHWRQGTYYPSKNRRLAQLANLDLEALVRSIYVGIAYCQVPELFVSITSQLASKLGFDDQKDSITTVAEIVGILSYTDAFDITKEHASASMMVVNRLVFPRELYDAMARSMYLPPMVCEPKEVTNNFTSPYLTFNECQILGKGNSHSGDICLDILNIQNRVPMKLDVDFLSTVEEEPAHDLDTPEKIHQWHTFKHHSYGIYHLLVQQGNRFWLTHKYDKRGRLYANGYHINTQGSAFKKACTELHNEKLVTGVPI